MSTFALIWCNVPKEVEVDVMDFEIMQGYCESQANHPMMNQGFTLCDAVSLKEKFTFNQSKFKIPGIKDFTIRDMSMLFDTNRFAIVFETKPKQVYFFDL